MMLSAHPDTYGDVRRRHEQVDEQHQHIADLIVAVEAAATSGDGAATIDAVLMHLLRYVDLHFATEERLMRESSYSGLVAHMAAHQRCRDELQAIVGSTGSLCAADLHRATSYLRGWFTEHQLTEDQRYMDSISE